MLLAEALRSSTFKFALACIAIFGIIVFALLGEVYLSTIAYVRSNLDRAIATEQTVLRKAFDNGGPKGAAAVVGERVAEDGFTGAFYALGDASFRPVAGNVDTWPSELRVATRWTTLTWPGGPVVRASVVPLPGGFHLLVAATVANVDAFTGRMRLAFLLSIALIFGLAGAASISVTRRTVGRIEAINATTRAIMRSGLSKRIMLRGTRDEWDKLSENLNAMLDRIEALVGEVKEVSDNVAHDLRTPLARIKYRLEAAQPSARDADADQLLIENSLCDLDDVLRMFTSLMRISRIEADAPRAPDVPIDLSKLAADVADLFDAASELKGGSIKVSDMGSVRVVGDRDLLFDALANLVDNAIKHGGRDGGVRIAIGEQEGRALISVSDDGPGIPRSEHDKVLKRFHRLESSRHTPGNGLGLSLVAAVARFHDLKIEMGDNAPGLTVTLRFPPTGQAATTSYKERDPISASEPTRSMS